MKSEHSIELMCRALKVSRSGFYEWRFRSIPEEGLPTGANVGRNGVRVAGSLSLAIPLKPDRRSS
jgi:hypothetical protein